MCASACLENGYSMAVSLLAGELHHVKEHEPHYWFTHTSVILKALFPTLHPSLCSWPLHLRDLPFQQNFLEILIPSRGPQDTLRGSPPGECGWLEGRQELVIATSITAPQLCDLSFQQEE